MPPDPSSGWFAGAVWRHTTADVGLSNRRLGVRVPYLWAVRSMVTPIVASAETQPNDPCVCGAIHRVPTDVVVIDEHAVERLAAYVAGRGWSLPLVVMDANTEEAAGSRVVAELSRANMPVTTFCFPERSGLLANETSVSRLHEELKASTTDSIIAVGSGVITDTTRYVASLMGRQFVSVPTAASMDGYASNLAVMEFRGMKRSFPVAPPVAIFADPRIIAAAPRDLTRAGLGDLFGKASAHVDWLASHELYGERYCAEVERRVTTPLVDAVTHVQDILAGSLGAVSGFLSGLVESGIAMAMIGNSRPASGCEHHASHFWDMLAASGRRSHAPHGFQVGYATHFAMRLQQYAFGGGIQQLAPPCPIAPDGDDTRSWFTGHNAEVVTVLDEKRQFLGEHAHAWPATQSRVGNRAGESRRGDGRLPPCCRGLVGGGHPVRARIPRSRCRHARGNLPVGGPDSRPLHGARLPGRPGQAR